MIESTISSSYTNRVKGIDNLIDMVQASQKESYQYECTGIDPQCRLLLKDNLEMGWYNLEYFISLKKGRILNPKLYLDIGNGFNEKDIILLPESSNRLISQIIYLPEKVFQIRFDPTEKQFTNFILSNLFLRKLSGYSLFKELNKKKIELLPSSFRPVRYFKTAVSILKNDVKRIENLLNSSNHKRDPFQYQDWIKIYDTYSEEEYIYFEKTELKFSYRPLISILLPTFNTPIEWLKECINSVIKQAYSNWELCIADDCSINDEVRVVIEAYASNDKRIKYIFRNINSHIAITSNAALSLAAGEFVALLDHDDILAPLALYRIAEALNEDSSTDFFYSDEDKINVEGERSLPFFKPDWSPALFFSQNYITHLACIRKVFLNTVNGFTEGTEGSQDYDLFLKVIAAGARIKHLPYILYHWRLHQASTSLVSGSKPYAHIAGKKAIEKFLAIKYPIQYNRVDDGENTFIYQPRFNFDKKNKITVIIPTKDNIKYLSQCIESIIKLSTWLNYEIIILNNNSEEEASFIYFKKVMEKYETVKVIDALFEFNWSKLNNFGYKHATGNYLIFLNNDITVISPDWMERLCEYASLPDVATVGATLLYEDNTVQHAGVVLGMNGWADHIFKGMHLSHFPSPFISSVVPRNVLAITGACVAIERIKFENLGMFDENFIICGSDVELGIRAHKNNFFNVIQSTVKLYHYESKSRDNYIPENDFIQSAIKYEPYRTEKSDPFFNPNLSLTDTSPTCKM